MTMASYGAVLEYSLIKCCSGRFESSYYSIAVALKLQGRHESNINAGLNEYPILQCANLLDKGERLEPE